MAFPVRGQILGEPFRRTGQRSAPAQEALQILLIGGPGALSQRGMKVLGDGDRGGERWVVDTSYQRSYIIIFLSNFHSYFPFAPSVPLLITTVQTAV